MSYANVIMYSAVIPSYNSPKEEKSKENKGLSFGSFLSTMKAKK